MSALLRLGTRGSLLARTQSGHVAAALMRLHPSLRVELVTIKTSGDRITDVPLAQIGGKGLFTKELELALLAGEIDIAVHSLKDVPVTMPLVSVDDLAIVAIPPRADPRDALIASPRQGRLASLGDLRPGMRIGTGSTRRRCQLLAGCPGLEILPLRGNVDTRLWKVASGEMDAIVLAMAGLVRVERFSAEGMTPLPVEQMLPAAGQGALAIQCRVQDVATREWVAPLNDAASSAAVAAERQIVSALEGDCHSPIAALAEVEGDGVRIRAVVGSRDGNLPVISASALGVVSKMAEVVERVVGQLRSQNAMEMLHPDFRHTPPS